MSLKKSVERLISLVAILTMLLMAAQASPAVAAKTAQDLGGGPVQITDGPAASELKPQKSAIDPNKQIRVIVQLKDPSVASYRGGIAGIQATSPKATGDSKFQADSAPSAAYTQYLVSQQVALQSALTAALPGAKVERSYQVVLNGLAVSNVRAGDIAKLKALPGVASVTVEREFKVEMDGSLPQIGLGTGAVGESGWIDDGLWKAVGGHAKAGKGIKIADIDSGITLSNPCFSSTGFSYPAGFPKYGTGYAAYVNPKVIAARAYFRADDPPFYPATPQDDPGSAQGGHGTHTAGTMACNYGTASTLGQSAKISGVAPAAQLMVYRVFYQSLAGSHSAWDPELIAAIEDAVKDGADVVNNSWGGIYVVGGIDDPMAMAYEAAVDAGVVIVFSAGNSGPNSSTAGSPGSSSDKFITVAATTSGRIFGNKLVITSASAPALLVNVVGLPGTGPALSSDLMGKEITYSPANLLGCTAGGGFPAGFFSDKIAYIKRGTCTFSEKIINATGAGAVAVVIGQNSVAPSTTAPTVMSAPGTTIPAIMIGTHQGNALQAYIDSQHALPAAATGNLLAGSFSYIDAGWGDFVADFSSRGPAPDLRLKPDITAPGVNILSSVSAYDYGDSSASFELYQGTSMAAPHVTGAAALMVQLHPDWTPAMIKSALMSTSAEPAALSINPVDRGAGRLSLAVADKVGATFDKPSLSFGLVIYDGASTVSKQITVTATNTTAAAITYDLAVTKTIAIETVSVSTPTLTVPAHGSASFDVQITAGSTVSAQTFGKITLTDPSAATPALHLPYWGYRVNIVAGKDFLLIDDDGSPDLGCADLLPAYTATLDALGYTYDVLDAKTTSINWFEAREYSRGIIYFQPPGNCSYFRLNSAANATYLRNYMTSGGRMLIFGQDFMGWDSYLAGIAGYASILPELFFGAQYVQDDLFKGSLPEIAVVGDKTYSTFLSQYALGLNPTTTTSVDELDAPDYTDMDNLPVLLSAPLGTALAKGIVGTRSSTEPNLERLQGVQPWARYLHRGMLLSFGLGDVIDAPVGPPVAPNASVAARLNSRAELLGELDSWLQDEASAAFTAPKFISTNPEIAVALDIDVDSFLGYVVQVRMDYGDGSPIVTLSTDANGNYIANHKYAKMGNFTAHVEAWDSYGHKAVASTLIQVGHVFHFPLIMR